MANDDDDEDEDAFFCGEHHESVELSMACQMKRERDELVENIIFM